MMDLPMAQKKIIFRSLIATCVLVDLLSLACHQSSEDILNIEFSEEIKERMRTVTDENINKAIERLLEINKSP
jgi:hypothetical protein